MLCVVGVVGLCGMCVLLCKLCYVPVGLYVLLYAIVFVLFCFVLLCFVFSPALCFLSSPEMCWEFVERDHTRVHVISVACLLVFVFLLVT